MKADEAKLQAECFKWFWNTFPAERRMLFHVDNNSWNTIVGAKKKALGVVQGVSDMVLILDCSVEFLEFKTDDGKQSEEQIDFQYKVNERCHRYIIIRSVEQFKIYIHGKLKR